MYAIFGNFDKTLNLFLQFLTWGLRELKDFKQNSVNSPHLEIEVGGQTLVIKKIESVKKHANFDNPRNYLDVMLPVEELYLPPINIRVLDNRCSGSLNNNNHDWIERLILVQGLIFIFSILYA